MNSKIIISVIIAVFLYSCTEDKHPLREFKQEDNQWWTKTYFYGEVDTNGGIAKIRLTEGTYFDHISGISEEGLMQYDLSSALMPRFAMENQAFGALLSTLTADSLELTNQVFSNMFSNVKSYGFVDSVDAPFFTLTYVDDSSTIWITNHPSVMGAHDYLEVVDVKHYITEYKFPSPFPDEDSLVFEELTVYLRANFEAILVNMGNPNDSLHVRNGQFVVGFHNE
jgi:hypothetical protein